MFYCINLVYNNNNTYLVNFCSYFVFLIKPEIATNLSLFKVCKAVVNLIPKSPKIARLKSNHSTQ